LDAVAGDEDVGVRANGSSADVDEFAGEDGLGDGGRLLSVCGAGGAKGRKGCEEEGICARHLRIKVTFAP
jgi:hypothetical protein